MKKKKIKSKETQKLLAEWLYFASGEQRLRGLYECVGETEGQKAELWEEAGVLEIGLPGGGSVDLEILEADMWEEDLRTFAQEPQADWICTVTFAEEDLAQARKMMNELTEKAGGIFCQDNEALFPRIGERKTEDGGA